VDCKISFSSSSSVFNPSKDYLFTLKKQRTVTGADMNEVQQNFEFNR